MFARHHKSETVILRKSCGSSSWTRIAVPDINPRDFPTSIFGSRLFKATSEIAPKALQLLLEKQDCDSQGLLLPYVDFVAAFLICLNKYN